MRTLIVGLVCLIAGALMGRYQCESTAQGLSHELARARNTARQMWIMAEEYRVKHVPKGPPLPEGLPYQEE
jgi:hypothetical protein